ncbi:hypothetical protein YC2023_041483 [Brassica napus]
MRLVEGNVRQDLLSCQQERLYCEQYNVDKILCEHAIKAAQFQKIDEATLVDPCFTKGYLFAAHT